jgi:pyrimidine-nucleoside phosphorylase
MDVKFGSGAFMRDPARATELAHALVKTGNSCDIRTRALLTDMNQPLGNAVGNSTEVLECVEILRGEMKAGAEPVLELSLELSAHMLVLARVEESLSGARAKLEEALTSGRALECFRQNVQAQGGDPRVADEPDKVLPLVRDSFRVESPRSGFISSIDTTEVGHAIAAIGGGRVRIEDTIDPTVGFMAEAKIGSQLEAGESLGVIFCRDQAKAREAAQRISDAYSVTEDRPKEIPQLIKEVINE